MPGAARRFEQKRRPDAAALEARALPRFDPLRRLGRNAVAWLGAAITLAVGWSSVVHRERRR